MAPSPYGRRSHHRCFTGDPGDSSQDQAHASAQVMVATGIEKGDGVSLTSFFRKPAKSDGHFADLENLVFFSYNPPVFCNLMVNFRVMN